MENPTFTPDEDVQIKQKDSPEPTIIEIPEPSCCCSWTRICDVMGDRQNLFIQSLRPLKHPLAETTQQLSMLEIGLERGMRSHENTVTVSKSVHNLIKSINNITGNSVLNVPPDENEMLRRCANNLAVLARIIDQLIREDNEKQESAPIQEREEIEEASTSITNGKQVRHTASGASAIDEHSLKERLEHNVAMLENLLKFVDKKTQRRWWLRDVINASQLVIKVALFISASLAVFYPTVPSDTGTKDKDLSSSGDAQSDVVSVFPIITLALTIAQGVIEVLDQYFLKNKKPEDIKLEVVTVLAGAAGKG